MGKVFTFAELFDSEGRRVPTIGAFQEVIHEIRRILKDTTAIEAAAIIGSASRNDLTIRSNIDCIVVYSDKKQETAYEILRALVRYGSSRYVPVRFIPVVSNKKCTIESVSFQHIQRHQRPIRGDVLLFLKNTLEVDGGLTDIRRKEEVLSNGRGKFRNMSPKGKVDFLQKILEYPVYIARSILVLYGILGDDDSKIKVVSEYCTIVQGETAALLRELYELDVWYTQKVTHGVSCEEYRMVWQLLVAEIVKAIQFAQKNVLMCECFIEHRGDDIFSF